MAIVDHLIADTFGTHIGKYSERLKVTQKGKVLMQAPLMHLATVSVLSRGVSISADALQACCERGIPIYFLNSIGHPYASVYASGLAGTVITRREQMRAFDDERGIYLALSFAEGKIQNQAITLKYLARSRKETDLGEELHLLAGDDLFAVNRPRGLPIGNLTSQFWSNCYLNPLDWFVGQDLGCSAYLRYVDDMALFSNSKRELYAWKQAIIAFLATLRLTIHETKAQVAPVGQGIPWLGFVVYPQQRRVKARNVVKFSRRLRQRWHELGTGDITFAEFDASVQGWINHVRYADTWGLRRHVLGHGLSPPE